MSSMATKSLRAGRFLPSIVALNMAMELARVIGEEEDKLREDFPGAQIYTSKGYIPMRITVVYDFLNLNKEERHRFFDFERRLLNRLDETLKEYLGEELPDEAPPPVEVEFIRPTHTK